MLRSVLLKRLPLYILKNELLLQVTERKILSPTYLVNKNTRYASVSAVNYKKRKSPEERAVENRGGRVIRYSPKGGTEVVGIWRNMTVQDVADVLKKDVDHVYKALEFADKESTVEHSPDAVIHNDHIVRDVVKISGCRFKIVPRPDEVIPEEECRDAVPQPPAAPEALRPRPPVVCVMGHVDHGKTSLLDALRHTAVVDTEFGGITQHIGAFEVDLPGGERVTFLDTPGHAAFSAMRARGASATDLVALVVAADDGVMPQTRESIRMAREAGVPILVAINKIDKPGVNIERTLRELAAEGVVCEALGGEVQAVCVSARARLHLDALVEALALQAQLLDLRADPAGPVEGVVLEARIDPYLGKQATVLVQRGTLRRGCVLVAGHTWAKVRALQGAEGRARGEAPPAAPVAVLGWRELPAAGDRALQVDSERRAGEVVRWRRAARMRERQAEEAGGIAARAAEQRAQYERALSARRAAGRLRERPAGPRAPLPAPDDHPALCVLLKGDVAGSVEAIVDLMATYDDHERVRLHLVHHGVGPVTPSDLELAEAFGASIYAFNVACGAELAARARAAGLPLRRHDVIYRLAAELQDELSARLPPRQEEDVLGEASVLASFEVSEGRRRVPVAGARVVRGALARPALCRVLRDGHVVYEGQLASMRHVKEEVTSVKCDTECGLRFEPPFAARPGDRVVAYRTRAEPDRTRWQPAL